MPTTPWTQFKCGVFFGMGLMIAVAVLKLIGWFISQANFPNL